MRSPQMSAMLPAKAGKNRYKERWSSIGSEINVDKYAESNPPREPRRRSPVCRESADAEVSTGINRQKSEPKSLADEKLEIL